LGDDAGWASDDVPGGLIDDVALMTPWGFDVTTLTVPVLLVHDGQDRVVPPANSRWLLEHCPTARVVVATPRRPCLGPRRLPGGDGLAPRPAALSRAGSRGVRHAAYGFVERARTAL